MEKLVNRILSGRSEARNGATGDARNAAAPRLRLHPLPVASLRESRSLV